MSEPETHYVVRSHSIIRAAVYIECANVLSARAESYKSRGKLGREIARIVGNEADHLRDLAVKIRSNTSGRR